MTQNQSKTSSTKLSESEAIAYWAKKEAEFLNRLRASGHTVTVVEGSDGELTASIPQGKKPSATPETMDGTGPSFQEVEKAVQWLADNHPSTDAPKKDRAAPSATTSAYKPDPT